MRLYIIEIINDDFQREDLILMIKEKFDVDENFFDKLNNCME